MRIFISFTLFLISCAGFSQSSQNINLLYNWHDSTITRTGPHDNAYNEVWGYTYQGREYGIIGSTRGTHIFDVTNPSSSVMADFVWGRDTGSQIVHRDYHDYQGYLYAVSDEGDASLQIMDLSYLPDSVHVVYDKDSLFKRSHNIFIDSATAKMYVCGGENKFDVYDLSNPIAPSLLKRCHVDVPWWASTVDGGSGGYVHDVYVRNDTAWCNAGDGLYVVDFTNMANPVLLASLKSYPHDGYNHSGWLSEDGKTYALADETHGKKVKLFDVSDLNNITFIDTIGSGSGPYSIPHNLIFKGDYLYVAYYFDGLYVWNIANPNNPYLVGFFDTSDEINMLNYRGNWGVYPFLPSGTVLASDMQKGFFVFDVSQALSDIEENQQNKERFKVFPNPFQNQINLIGLAEFNQEYSLQIIDATGKVIHNRTITNRFLTPISIELNEAKSKGLYTIILSSKDFVQQIRIVKQ